MHATPTSSLLKGEEKSKKMRAILIVLGIAAANGIVQALPGMLSQTAHNIQSC